MDPFKTQFIIEGCDCTGKTSLINSLLNFFKENKVYAPVVKFSAPVDPKQYEGVAHNWLNMAENMVEPIIFDRFVFSERVYGPIFRKSYPIYMDEVEKQLPSSFVLVLVEASPENVKKRFDGEFIDEEQIEEILFRYGKEFSLSPMKNKILINTDKLTPYEAAKYLIAKVMEI